MHQYIGGALSTGTAGETAAVVDPSTGEVLRTAEAAGPADVDRAVAAAAGAFPAWADTAPAARAAVLARAAALLEDRAEEFGRAETRQTGKPIGLSRRWDVPAALGAAALSAAAARQAAGGAGGTARREPVGVVACLAPRSHPLRTAAAVVLPAVAAGNAVVVKPPAAAPLTALLLARLLTEAGLPDGVVNVVTGSGRVAGASLVRHPEVAAVAFTGSRAAAREVAAGAAGGLPHLRLEPGGAAPFVVHEDADLAAAVPGAVAAGLLNSGQDGSAATRALVHRSLLADFVAGVAERFAAVRIGPPGDEATELGPLASFSRRHRVAALVERARRHARIVTGGSAPGGGLAAGAYYRPTLVTGAAADSEIARAAVPGPVLAVLPFDAEEEAVLLANDVPAGPAASVWTRDLGRARRTVRGIRAGCVGVNEHPRDGGAAQAGLEAYTQVKHVVYGED
ncbi:aldehyde dehydrogenase family protein [Streptomyces johnsoniae]|uniref:Aldehyde dehydrogenase family protein n=1 Tax=Streptomyces johnsoniae TaxID=3075532 RepID=A0ABU2S300_9ACTN|nr:aldehyde dehydrogenase family protein [Streptomyces sp. DSM 41886]MDT0442460.1 aldehyde dehydrogenase family protein [Streptomyces sp. DSM 41886]